MNFLKKWFKKTNGNNKNAKSQDIDNLELNKTDKSTKLIFQGIRFGQSKKFDKAIETLKEAIRINPDSAEVAYITLAMAYRGKDMIDKSFEILHQVEEKRLLNNENHGAMDFDLYFTFTTIYIRKNDKTNAVKYAKKAIKSNDNLSTKKRLDEAAQFMDIENSDELSRSRAPMIKGLKELIKEYDDENN